MRKRTPLSILAVLSPLLAAWACGALATEFPGIDPNLIVAEFDVARDGDGLLLPVRVNGKEYHFLLDTGSQVNAFDECLLGSKEELVTVDAFERQVTESLADAPDATVGRIPFTGAE